MSNTDDFYKGAVDILKPIVDSLDDRYSDVIKKRYGLDSDSLRLMTLEEIAKSRFITRERVRQIEQKAMRVVCAVVNKESILPYSSLGIIPNYLHFAYVVANFEKFDFGDRLVLGSDQPMINKVIQRLEEQGYDGGPIPQAEHDGD